MTGRPKLAAVPQMASLSTWTPSTQSTTSKTDSVKSDRVNPTSSRKSACPGQSIKFTAYDVPVLESLNSKLTGLARKEIPRSCSGFGSQGIVSSCSRLYERSFNTATGFRQGRFVWQWKWANRGGSFYRGECDRQLRHFYTFPWHLTDPTDT